MTKISGIANATIQIFGQDVGINDPIQTDTAISRLVVQKLTPGTYSSVRVSTIKNYEFDTVTRDVRVIKLSVGLAVRFLHILKQLFQTPQIINENGVEDAFFGSEDIRDIDDYKIAYAQNWTITIAISTDLYHYEFEMASDWIVDATQGTLTKQNLSRKCSIM